MSKQITRYWTRILILSAACTLFVSVSVVAQTSTAIEGTVIDEQGGKISGAGVRLLSRERIPILTTSDPNGSFQFRDLIPGEYLIEVKAEGFSTFVSEEISLNRGHLKSLKVQLKIASLNESVVVTATGTAQRVDEVAKGFSLVDSQQIEDRKEWTVSESLRGTPGLRVQQQGSPGALTTLRLRGQRPFDTALLLDGLRVRDASDINGSAVSLIADLAPIAIDRVEVLRGSGSSIYGTNAIGGVVNLVPESGAGGPRFEFAAEGGGLRSARERARASGGGERFGYSLGLSRLDVRRGIDGNDQYGNTAGTGRVQFNPNSAVTIVGTFYGTTSNLRVNDSPFALAGSFTSAQPFPAAVAGVTFQPDFNNPDQGRRHRLLVGSVRFSQQVNERLSYTVAYQRVSSNRRNYNGPRIDPRFAAFYPFGDFEFVAINRGVTDTVDGRLNARIGRRNLVTAGVEFENESSQQQFLPGTSVLSPPDRQRTFAVFGQDQLSLFDDRLQVSLGARGQFFQLRAADRPGQLAALTPKSSLTGDGAIAYFLRSSNTKLRAHVGNGFRAPALFERFGFGTFAGMPFSPIIRFGDPTLKAEQSISVDAGFDQHLANDRMLLGATYFYTRLQRSIVFIGFAPDPLGLRRPAGFANQPGGIARGFESFLETTPFRGTDIRASYTFTNSDRSLQFGGLAPEFVVPKHVVGFTWSQRLRSFAMNVDVNRTGSYITRVFENDFPFRIAELTFDGFTRVDMFASYKRRLSERVTMVFFGGADNVFGAEYFENGFRAPRAVGRGGINLRF